MKSKLITILLILSNFLYSINQDSLLNIFNNGNANAEVLNQLASTYYPQNTDSGYYFANMALKFAKQKSDNQQIGEAYYQIGDYYYYNSIVDSVLFYYHKSLNFYLKTDLNNVISGIYNDIGQVYQIIHKQDSAKIYFDFALDYIDKDELPIGYYSILANIANTYYNEGKYAYSNEQYKKIIKEGKNELDPNRLSAIYSNIGLNYKKLSIYDKAIDYYNEALKIDDSLGLEVNLAVDYGNIAGAYYSWKKFDLALDYFNKAYDLYKENNKKCKMASIMSNIAAVYRAKKDYQTAFNYYNAARDTSINQNCKYELASALHGLGLTYYKTNNYIKSIDFEKKSLPLFIEMNTVFAIINVHLSLGRNYMAINENKLAEKHLSIADSMSSKTESIELMRDVSLEFAKLYNSVGKTSKSVFYYEKFIMLNDSMFNEKSHKLISEYQVRLDNLDKQRQLEKSEFKNQAQLIKINQKNNLLWALGIGTFILLLLLIFIYRLYLQKHKSYQLLFEKNKEQLRQQNIKVNKRVNNRDKEFPDDLQQKIINGIHNLMDEQKLYLNPNLNAHKLAEKLKTNTSYLSKTINEYFDLNFNNLVNKYRIDEAQNIILSGKFSNYTIEALSKECGFKSKSTFNHAFKKFTGLTPSYYISQNKK